ncbi:tRNA guanosine(15) transglycosylase TgtA [Methanothermobacter tenebrarum]|uniref:tRNA-guanine(15) transglycosylase n=1 Tax=Methanothermobacter tenebrarum TaxID=680118 RepID=A0A328PGD2_9EURY|nr:tRNA guanosine(15) transglycosylase TgtA [Methanothermobacter tenebrarum]MBC7118278.1 tRNA guanosine(15) transglycosylase TgtA [Methanobacteriaceae archaeon]NPV64573.1 tRNA guanosine(15) transglycosylase TgtA [Methanobacteriaceae archaeon]RAO78696.1 tRNA guanosine(15) transglycosylase TgtA [Methanothermobacter tenebrarum]
MFEIKAKDGLARAGIFTIGDYRVKTPALMPVIHPSKMVVDVKSFGAEIVITNAYIIYKNEKLRDMALKKGVHKLIGFDGPVVTDSGSFQLAEYGDIDVTNKEIIEFQEEIGADIGTSLDIPTPPYAPYKKAKEDLKITLERAKEALSHRENMMLNSVVQGSTYADLRKWCARELSRMDFDVHPIGAVVPLLESYDYKSLVEVVMASVEYLPPSRPRHLMGAGHPMLFALAVSMGCDLFDSAAYILYANDDRLLDPSGTYKLEDLSEMPCSCNVCVEYTPQELRSMEENGRRNLIAAHNLYVSFAEIRRVRQAINEGSLMELVDQRCRAHPRLLDAYRKMLNYQELIEKYDPVSKRSAFFYTGPESLRRVEVYRHHKRLNRLPKKKGVALLSVYNKPYSRHVPVDIGEFFSPVPVEVDEWQFMVVDIPFGIIPLELDEFYPFSQNESPSILDFESENFIRSIIKKLEENYKTIIVSKDINERFNLGFKFRVDPPSFRVSDKDRLVAVADYQFGEGAGEALFKGDLQIIKSKKTGRIRYIYVDDELIASIRTSDGFIIPSWKGASLLHSSLDYPRCRVVVDEESEPFAREGKNIFAKFVIECDKNIRANDEVLIVNEDDELLATGKSLLCSEEILDFNYGQAIKTRRGGR